MYYRLLTFVTIIALGAPITRSAAQEELPFATVDGTAISYEQFEREVYNEARNTFYHGTPPTDSELLEFRRGIADQLVDKALLLNEAERRGISPDHESIAAKLAVYEDRYADTERWEADGERMLSGLRQHFEKDSMLSILEGRIRAIAVPDDAVVRGYYGTHLDKFTEPSRMRVSAILLAVSPSSPPAAWEAARNEAADILRRLRADASFAELARVHSADPSSENGGDLGYLHSGMLSDAAQQALDQLEIGGLSEPVTVLEGIAVFKLTDRQDARLHPFAAVQQRATELWQRDEGEKVWTQTKSDLRAQSSISIDEEYLRLLPVVRQ